ncbi:hypothetical protein WJX82_011450 [Trebouxia sp. C0006]
MDRRVLTCMLFLVHCVTLLLQRLNDVCGRWKPLLRRQTSQSRGIRPPPPKCLAIALVDCSAQDSHQLPVVLAWCAKVGIQQAVIYDPAGSLAPESYDTLRVPVMHSTASLGLAISAEQPESTAWVSNRLHQSSLSAAMAEPELLLVFGKSFTLAGYAPWPLRSTEMYHMGRLKDITVCLLHHTLQQYCNTVQRFGR